MASGDGDRPRIVVTRWEDVLGEAVERYWARVAEAGGEVVDLHEANAASASQLMAAADGLMLTGGVDVDPARYGEARHAKVKETRPERDAMEMAALEVALARDLPVLAICRGHQLLNVALGGSLLQHIESGAHRADYRVEGYPSRWHIVRLTEGGRLAEALCATTFETNSRHHQAVDAAGLAPGLRAIAWADDRDAELVEGVVSAGHTWVTGVQWHPERPEEQRPEFAPRMRGLFAAFVAATRRVSA
jgi:gamma-glutamyl-gamma-aminobutyrate hydrolase PuuD